MLAAATADKEFPAPPLNKYPLPLTISRGKHWRSLKNDGQQSIKICNMQVKIFAELFWLTAVKTPWHTNVTQTHPLQLICVTDKSIFPFIWQLLSNVFVKWAPYTMLINLKSCPVWNLWYLLFAKQLSYVNKLSYNKILWSGWNKWKTEWTVQFLSLLWTYTMWPFKAFLCTGKTTLNIMHCELNPIVSEHTPLWVCVNTKRGPGWLFSSKG